MKSMTKVENRAAAQQQAQQPAERERLYMAPRVNITESNEGYLLEAEMPGVDKDGLEISLEANELTLTGRRQGPPQGLDLVYRESTQRDYRRVFVLDPTIDTSNIEARMENGVLKLHLPKAEQVKPRRITVNG